MASKASPLSSPSATSEVLALFGLSPKKALGQNFLVDDGVVRRILELADVGPEDDVLEVGPGIGTLTAALAAAARSVISIERDADLVPVLGHTMANASAFRLVMRDALDADAADIEAACDDLRAHGIACAFPRKLVANLPYAVAATVVLGFFQAFADLGSATVMVQREVADRMRAVPGTKDYGAYTVKLALFARPAGSFNVPPSCFLPRPHVDSTVIRLDRVPEADGAVDAQVREAACTMADAAFFARRKTIANSCKACFASRGRAVDVAAVLARAGVDPAVRGEALGIERYIALGRALLAEA